MCLTFCVKKGGKSNRYAINCNKLKTQLGWKQSVSFDKGLDLTVDWYLNSFRYL